MEILETAALWCVDKAAILLERIGLAVIPLWNRWNWEHDMLTVLLMLASVLLAVVCAGLSLAHPNGKEMEKEEARMDKLGTGESIMCWPANSSISRCWCMFSCSTPPSRRGG